MAHEHRAFRIEHERPELVAVCTCGWRSARTRVAGIAGGLWDIHVGRVEADVASRAS